MPPRRSFRRDEPGRAAVDGHHIDPRFPSVRSAADGELPAVEGNAVVVVALRRDPRLISRGALSGVRSERPSSETGGL